jgi:hypothetical protein
MESPEGDSDPTGETLEPIEHVRVENLKEGDNYRLLEALSLSTRSGWYNGDLTVPSGIEFRGIFEDTHLGRLCVGIEFENNIRLSSPSGNLILPKIANI